MVLQVLLLSPPRISMQVTFLLLSNICMPTTCTQDLSTILRLVNLVPCSKNFPTTSMSMLFQLLTQLNHLMLLIAEHKLQSMERKLDLASVMNSLSTGWKTLKLAQIFSITLFNHNGFLLQNKQLDHKLCNGVMYHGQVKL